MATEYVHGPVVARDEFGISVTRKRIHEQTAPASRSIMELAERRCEEALLDALRNYALATHLRLWLSRTVDIMAGCEGLAAFDHPSRFAGGDYRSAWLSKNRPDFAPGVLRTSLRIDSFRDVVDQVLSRSDISKGLLALESALAAEIARVEGTPVPEEDATRRRQVKRRAGGAGQVTAPPAAPAAEPGLVAEAVVKVVKPKANKVKAVVVKPAAPPAPPRPIADWWKAHAPGVAVDERATVAALGDEPVACLIGLAGSGKTHNAIKRAAERGRADGRRVIIVSPIRGARHQALRLLPLFTVGVDCKVLASIPVECSGCHVVIDEAGTIEAGMIERVADAESLTLCGDLGQDKDAAAGSLLKAALDRGAPTVILRQSFRTDSHLLVEVADGVSATKTLRVPSLKRNEHGVRVQFGRHAPEYALKAVINLAERFKPAAVIVWREGDVQRVKEAMPRLPVYHASEAQGVEIDFAILWIPETWTDPDDVGFDEKTFVNALMRATRAALLVCEYDGTTERADGRPFHPNAMDLYKYEYLWQKRKERPEGPGAKQFNAKFNDAFLFITSRLRTDNTFLEYLGGNSFGVFTPINAPDYAGLFIIDPGWEPGFTDDELRESGWENIARANLTGWDDYRDIAEKWPDYAPVFDSWFECMKPALDKQRQEAAERTRARTEQVRIMATRRFKSDGAN